MLLFTFCKVNPKDLRLHKWHWVVLFLQIALSLAAYAITYLLSGNRFLAQGLMLCFVMPTATAAPIIAGKLGGSIQNLTTFTLLSNFATAIVVPVLFPLVNPLAEKAFWPAFTLIISHISPLLLGPFFGAWLLRISYQWRTKKEFVLPTSIAVVPFYLWVCSIVVLTATVTETVIANFYDQLSNILILLVASFFACLLQFGLGKLIGYHLPAPSKGRDYQDVLINPAAAPKTMEGVSSITAGQAFGQKNTSLGVWMAQTYLHPLAALGAAAYIIWQNLFNSVQLFVVAHKK
jgi:BASS family bile acid:Na+ symporter